MDTYYSRFATTEGTRIETPIIIKNGLVYIRTPPDKIDFVKKFLDFQIERIEKMNFKETLNKVLKEEFDSSEFIESIYSKGERKQ